MFAWNYCANVLEIMNRREFLGAGLGMASALAAPRSAAIDETLRTGIAKRKIPAVVGMAASSGKTLYAGAFGKRDAEGPAVRVDNIFRIASMTKAVTTVAALQLVERGKVALDEPVARHLPEFEKARVLEGFDAGGKPVLRAPKTQPTLRQLLTHTSGLCYDIWDEMMFRYTSQYKLDDDVPGPLMFNPGARWQYGQGLDWTGKLVERLSGTTLEECFQEKIFRPLGMEDTSFVMTASKFDRLVSNWERGEDGVPRQEERKMPEAPKSYNGGGGLYSTAGDYTRFMQMILQGGVGPKGARILTEKTVESMEVNQIGGLTAGKMKSFRPALSADVDMQPGHTEKWGLGFLINTAAYEGGRPAGSLAWAGIDNTFYWIDLKRGLCAVLLMQFLPFVDAAAVGMLGDFERAVYAAGLGG